MAVHVLVKIEHIRHSVVTTTDLLTAWPCRLWWRSL